MSSVATLCFHRLRFHGSDFEQIYLILLTIYIFIILYLNHPCAMDEEQDIEILKKIETMDFYPDVWMLCGFWFVL